MTAVKSAKSAVVRITGKTRRSDTVEMKPRSSCTGEGVPLEDMSIEREGTPGMGRKREKEGVAEGQGKEEEVSRLPDDERSTFLYRRKPPTIERTSERRPN